MGEAKRRKVKDPSYGRPKRGLVVSSPLEIQGERLLVKSAQLDPQELRAWLLFFDRLVWPSSRIVYFGSGPDELFLEQCNVLTRPDYTMGGEFVQGIAHGQFKAFIDLDTKEPGQWALAQGENSLLLKDRLLVPDTGLMLELYNAIPVPDRDVPLNEILEFRLKRSDELELLRTELDGFVSQIDKADDKAAELAKRIAIIDSACADAIRVSHEWQFPVKLTDFKASFEIRPLVHLQVGAAAYGLGSVAGLSSTTNALAAVSTALVSAASCLKISNGFGWKGIKRKMGPYRYVYQFHNELF
jgi:Family of unknown function (DUF6236)